MLRSQDQHGLETTFWTRSRSHSNWSWSQPRSHTFWSRGLKLILCSSSVMTDLCSVLLILVSGHYEHFTSEEIVIIIHYSSFIISNSLCNSYYRFVLLSRATELIILLSVSVS